MAIPNVFSPNGDGVNDLFGVSFGADLEVVAMTGTIYDRWGNLVYSSKESPFQWNGFYAGELVMPGVYAYIIQVEFVREGVMRQQIFYGDVTVVR
jgi:gliding motility-associated-like protein